MSEFNCNTDFCKQCGFDGELCKGCVKKKCYEQGLADAYEECARMIEASKTLFENHQTETIMVTKDKCIAIIRNSKEQKK